MREHQRRPPNLAFERAAGSHSLAAAAHRGVRQIEDDEDEDAQA